jgi:type I restriction enzyme, S subunit
MDSTVLQPEANYPTEWQRKCFEDFTTLKRGNDLTREQFRNGGVPVAGSNGIIGYHDTANVKAPGVTVGRSGSIGKVSFYVEDFWAHNTALFVTDFHGNAPRFAAYFLDFLNLCRFGSGASVPTLDRNVFRALAVIVPSVSEQEKIGSVLGLVQRAIERQEPLIALTTELTKSLMHKFFTEGLRGERQKQTEIGAIPKSWKVRPLRDCCLVQTGIAKGRKVEASEALILPYLRVANVQAGHLDLREMKTITIRRKEKDRYMLKKGDVVLTEGGDFDKLGRGFIWNGEIEDCIHQNHIFAVRVDRSQLLPEFLAHLSQSPYGKAYFLSVAHKTTNLACINTTKLKGFPVLIPTLTEQEEIVQMLGAVNAKLAHHVRKKQSLSDLFRTLLHQLMTAQIRVHDLDLSFIEQDAVAS